KLSSNNGKPKSRWRWVTRIFAFVGVCILGTIIYGRATAPPEFEGRPVTDYLGDLERPGGTQVRRDAIKAVRTVGVAALGDYLELAEGNPPIMVRFYRNYSTNMPKWMASRLFRAIDPYAYENQRLGA